MRVVNYGVTVVAHTMMEITTETLNTTLQEENNEEIVSDKVFDDGIEGIPVNTKTSLEQTCKTEKPEENNETVENDDKNNTHFDAFTDENNQIYKKYQLRNTDKRTSRVIKEEDTDQSSDYKPPEKKKKKIKEKEYKCTICSMIVENQLNLNLHMRKHISKNKFTCARCQEIFETNNELLDHKKTHSDEEICYMCTKCEKAFSNELTFLRHGFIHIKKGPFKCPECLVISTDRKSIQHHILNHFEIRDVCKICNTLVLKRNMSSHVNSHTTVKCVECGKICSNKAHYQYHLTSHTGVKLHQCLYCGRGFGNSGQKKIHMKLHTGEKSFECTICFQKFTQQSTKSKHELTHDIEKKFECAYCGNKFKNKAYIKYHLRLHNNDKPYQCPNCPQKFATSGHLTSHTYTAHMKKKLFGCDLCNVEFSLKKGYTRHIGSKTHQKNAYRSKMKLQGEHEE